MHPIVDHQLSKQSATPRRPNLPATAALIVLLVAVGLSRPAPSHAGCDPNPGNYSNPVPTMICSGDDIVLRMELNGYPFHGATDNACDTQYPGNVHDWSFTVPACVPIGAIQSAFIRIAMIADPGGNVGADTSLYAMRVGINHDDVFNGPAHLPHGVPDAFAPFTNWVVRDYPVAAVQPVTTVTLENTTQLCPSAWYWLGYDWIELHLVGVGCASPAHRPSWGSLKSLYR